MAELVWRESKQINSDQVYEEITRHDVSKYKQLRVLIEVDKPATTEKYWIRCLGGVDDKEFLLVPEIVNSDTDFTETFVIETPPESIRFVARGIGIYTASIWG